MQAFWGRSFVSVGGTTSAAPSDGDLKAYTRQAGMIGRQPPDETFSCTTAGDACIAQAAARCTQLGNTSCRSFSYDRKWNPLAAELFVGGIATASHNPAWTLYVKKNVTASVARDTDGRSGAVSSRLAIKTAPPFALNQQYLLFRYLQLIQGNGSTAIHFNGGIIDWGATGDPNTPRNVDDHGTPDYRQWGGAFWFRESAVSILESVHID
eukprot:SAG25_NODE_2106_length_1945_cov_1.539003_3_plen_210_part_00